MRAYADENHSCTTAVELVDCAASHGGLTGVSMIHAKPFTHFVPPDIKLEKISKFHNFRFDKDGIRAFEAYQIGVGKSIEYFGKVNAGNQRLIEVSKIYHAGNQADAPAKGDAYWLLLGELRTKTTQDDPTDKTDSEGSEGTVFCVRFIRK